MSLPVSSMIVGVVFGIILGSVILVVPRYLSARKFKNGKTHWLIKRQVIVKAPPFIGERFLVYKKTGFFSKKYIGHAHNLYEAERLTGKHSHNLWDFWSIDNTVKYVA